MRLKAIRRASAARALDQLVELPIQASGTSALIQSVWSMSDFLTPYDACYAALAMELAAPFITADEKLARSLARRDHRALFLGAL